MTIEVRQILIKAQVGTRSQEEAPVNQAWLARQREDLKRELMAECRAWLERQLQQQRER